MIQIILHDQLLKFYRRETFQISALSPQLRGLRRRGAGADDMRGGGRGPGAHAGRGVSRALPQRLRRQLLVRVEPLRTGQ